MSSTEETNIATLELWLNEVHANRQVDLGPGLLAPSYARHRPSGTDTLTPESFTELSESGILSHPRFRYEWLEIVARGDRVSGVWRAEEHNDERRSHNALGIYRFEDGKIAELWQPKQPASAELWSTEPRPREQWSIASADTLTAHEQANLATLNHWIDLQEDRSHDFESLAKLMVDPVAVHGAGGTSAGSREDRERSLIEFRERSPDYKGSTDDLFVVSDLAARRYRYSYAESLSDRGNFQCGVVIYRFEDHRIVEYWNIYLPNDVDWD